MIKVFIPENKSRENKPRAKGFWLDNGKVYYDYLRIEQGDFTLAQIKEIASTYNQLAVFFINEDKGFIYDTRTNKTEVLPIKESLVIDKKQVRYFIKVLLRKYNGVTVYDLDGSYYIEVYHK